MMGYYDLAESTPLEELLQAYPMVADDLRWAARSWTKGKMIINGRSRV